ncbi:MAG: GNAT family N-acetyltransferase [Chloroflexi bacterium]|nr:GNAT family N-acetyltransferase [Chloroflexota bacterium]
MESLVVRRARPVLQDAQALLAVERASLNDSPYGPEELLAVLRRPEHYAYLAYDGATPAGLCSCFETPTDAGLRLEVDALGVAPAYRGCGLATRLILHSVDEARRRGTSCARAVVAERNTASRRTFERARFVVAPDAGVSKEPVSECGRTRGSPLPVAHPGAGTTTCRASLARSRGYETGSKPSPRDMLVYEVRGVAPRPMLGASWAWHVVHEGAFRAPGAAGRAFCADGPGRWVGWLADEAGRTAAMAECLSVQTMAYRGIWVEALWATSRPAERRLARALVEQSKALAVDEVGYLRPQSGGKGGLLPWVREGYQVVGRYHVLVLGRL